MAAGALLAVAYAGALAGAQGAVVAAAAKPESPLSTTDIVQRMVAMNLERNAALQAYTEVTHYHVTYHGFGTETAEMTVKVTYQDGGPKQFTEVSASGSGMLRQHVLEPLLKAQRHEAAVEDRDGGALVPENYDFELVDSPQPGTQNCYVLAVKPVRDAKRFLFRGKIWVNPKDFGIERAEGDSVSSPSFWVSRFHFQVHSRKIGDFWVPASSRSTSHVRVFGHAVLDMTFSDFQVTAARPVNFLAAEGSPR